MARLTPVSHVPHVPPFLPPFNFSLQTDLVLVFSRLDALQHLEQHGQAHTCHPSTASSLPATTAADKGCRIGDKATPASATPSTSSSSSRGGVDGCRGGRRCHRRDEQRLQCELQHEAEGLEGGGVRRGGRRRADLQVDGMEGVEMRIV